MRIGFDLDGVIVDHTENKIKMAKELGFDLTPPQTPHDILKPLVSKDAYNKIQKYIYAEASLSALPIEHALTTIEELSRTHSLFIISRRMSAELAWEWLRKKNVTDFIPEKNIFFVEYNIRYAKNAVAKKVGIDLFVDDEAKILRELPAVDTRIHFDQYGTAPSEFYQIKKWQELSAIINAIH